MAQKFEDSRGCYAHSEKEHFGTGYFVHTAHFLNNVSQSNGSNNAN
jgi:hypothetical protein